MIKSLLAKLRAFLGPLMCNHGAHRWAFWEDRSDLRYCTRPGCSAAQERSKSGLWVNGVLPQVTMDEIQKLNRHERRRLGSMARRGVFGRLPE